MEVSLVLFGQVGVEGIWECDVYVEVSGGRQVVEGLLGRSVGLS